MSFVARLCIIATIIICSCGQASSTEPKKLTAKEMSYISIGVWWIPSFMVNAWKARNLAQETLTTVENNPTKTDIEFVQKNRDPLVKSLNGFLGIARMAKSTVLPPLKQSLGEKSILWRLFNSNESSKKFFAKEVQDVKSLTALSNEFTTFFQDLEVSLSPRSKRVYEKARNKQIKPA